MDLFVVGIKRYELIHPLKELQGWGYNFNIVFHHTFDDAQQVIDVGTKVDLILLGGIIHSKDQEDQIDYDLAVKFAERNPNIPSILLVYPVYTGIIDRLNYVHPPNATRAFSEFGNLGKQGIEHILKNQNFTWRL
ncbi:MAG: hypothetical protein WC254_01165 [Candidatus Woesearchaeota archaeon]|jgi:hypothetical protein